MGDLLDSVVGIRVDRRNEAAAKAAADKANEEKSKLETAAKALDEQLAAGRLELVTKASQVAKAEHEERLAEVEEQKRRLLAEERAIVVDRARRGNRVLSPTDLRVRATRSLHEQDTKALGKKGEK